MLPIVHRRDSHLRRQIDLFMDHKMIQMKTFRFSSMKTKCKVKEKEMKDKNVKDTYKEAWQPSNISNHNL